MAKFSVAQQRKIYHMRMNDVVWKDVVSALGSTRGSCRWSFRQNKKKIEESGLDWREHFNLLAQLEEDQKADDLHDADEYEDEEVEDQKWLFNDDYTYNANDDVYMTFLPGVVRPLAVPGDIHRAMLQAYSDWDGIPATINEICRTFGIPRAWFEKYKRVHKWTHDMEPFVREEVQDRDVEEMVDDAFQKKRFALHQKFQRKTWKETKNDAEKWRRFEHSSLTPLIAAIENNAPSYTIPKITRTKKEGDKRVCAFVSLFCDLHFGKYSWKHESGDSYNRKIAKDRAIDAAKKIIDMVGRIDTIILPIGSDDIHVDNSGGKTTSGTDQDMDGTAAQIVIEYSELLITIIDMFRHIADKIILPVVHGNHNRHTAVMQGIIVDAWYRNSDDIEVISKAKPRNYIKYGVNLIGFTHGDSEKHAVLPGLMAKERPQDWADTKHRVWIVNHYHQEKLANIVDVRIYTVPALSGPDRWHHRKGFISDPAAAVYLFDHDQGISGNILVTPSC